MPWLFSYTALRNARLNGRAGAAILIFVVTAPGAPNQALWPGSSFTEADRTRAIDRGLAFIDRTARDPVNFNEYGADYLWCFYEIASTSAAPRLRARAWAIGREHARLWTRQHPHVDPAVSADDLADLLFGAYAAERLGFTNPALKEEIRRAASRFAPADFVGFDPATGPPRADRNLHDLLCDALITTYTADQYGVTLGAPYAQTARWLSLVRPYVPGPRGAIPTINLVTHVVYTSNDYNARSLRPADFPDEFAFLKAHADDPMILDNGEVLGEFMDTLRAFGMTTRDPIVQRGFTRLLSTQNPDGSWGDPTSRDIYNRYHPTWTAIDGLREYRWRP